MALGLLFLLFCTLGTFGNAPVNALECSSETTRRCRTNIEDLMGGNGNTRKLELEDQCTRIRENFDCVLGQTSMCLKQEDQDSNSDIILKSWQYLKGFCENSRNWWTKPCYQREDLKRCENMLSKKGRSTDHVSCRGYLNFRDCVMPVVENECSSEDQRLLGTYLMDKGQHKAWKCSKDSYENGPASAPLAADTRDIMYSDTSYGSCIYDARQPVQDCLTNFEDIQKIALKENDNDMKVNKICCGLNHYEDCVERVLREKCGADSVKQIGTIVSSVKARFYDCKEHTKYVCSGAPLFVAFDVSILAFLLLPLITSTYFARIH